MFVLRLAVLSLILMAFGCVSQEPRNPASEQASEKRNPWWGASDEQVEIALCRNRLPRTTLELRNHFSQQQQTVLAKSDGSDVQLFDLKLINQPGTLVRSLYELLSPGPVFNAKVKQITDPKKRFHIADNCTTAPCVAEAIFGPNVGLQMLYLQSEFNINTSHYSYDDSALFTETELWDIFAALELLPKKILPFNRNQKLTHYAHHLEDKTILANATMGFYDRWSLKKSRNRQYIAFHEFAHNYSSNFIDNLTSLDLWLDATGWERTEENRDLFKKISEDRESEMISGYAKTNPREDFAESVSAYRLNPFELRELSPKRYQFIRDFVFDGIEFTHKEGCEREPFYMRLIQSGKIDLQAFSSQALEQIAFQCQPEYVATTLGNLPKSYFTDCVDREGLISYFTLIEKKPIPRILINEQFARSNVKIHGLADAILERAERKTMALIWQTVGALAPYRNPAKDCSQTPWTTLMQNLVVREGVSFTKKPLSFLQYKVSQPKVTAACKSIIGNQLLNGFSESAVLKYLQNLRRP